MSWIRLILICIYLIFYPGPPPFASWRPCGQSSCNHLRNHLKRVLVVSPTHHTVYSHFKQVVDGFCTLEICLRGGNTTISASFPVGWRQWTYRRSLISLSQCNPDVLTQTLLKHCIVNLQLQPARVKQSFSTFSRIILTFQNVTT